MVCPGEAKPTDTHAAAQQKLLAPSTEGSMTSEHPIREHPRELQPAGEGQATAGTLDLAPAPIALCLWCALAVPVPTAHCGDPGEEPRQVSIQVSREGSVVLSPSLLGTTALE